MMAQIIINFSSVLLFILLESTASLELPQFAGLDGNIEMFRDAFLENMNSSPCGIRKFDISQLTPDDIYDIFYQVTFSVDKSLSPLHAVELAELVAGAAKCKVYNTSARVFAEIYANAISKFLDAQKYLSGENVASLAHNLGMAVVETDCSYSPSSIYSNLELLYQSVISVVKDLDFLNETLLTSLTDLFVSELNELPSNC